MMINFIAIVSDQDHSEDPTPASSAREGTKDIKNVIYYLHPSVLVSFLSILISIKVWTDKGIPWPFACDGQPCLAIKRAPIDWNAETISQRFRVPFRHPFLFFGSFKCRIWISLNKWLDTHAGFFPTEIREKAKRPGNFQKTQRTFLGFWLLAFFFFCIIFWFHSVAPPQSIKRHNKTGHKETPLECNACVFFFLSVWPAGRPIFGINYSRVPFSSRHESPLVRHVPKSSRTSDDVSSRNDCGRTQFPAAADIIFILFFLLLRLRIKKGNRDPGPTKKMRTRKTRRRRLSSLDFKISIFTAGAQESNVDTIWNVSSAAVIKSRETSKEEKER